MQKQLEGKFTTQGYSHALNIFNFPSEYNRTSFHINSLKYLLQNYKYVKKFRRYPSIQELSKRTLDLYENLIRKNDIQNARELEDLYVQYLGNMDTLTEIVRDIVQVPQGATQVPQGVPQKREKTIYEDGQNVHNSFLNKSVLSVAYNLVKTLPPNPVYNENDIIESICCILIQKYPEKKDIILKTEKYINSNISRFSYKNTEFSIQEVFISVWFWLINNKNSKELELRLLEEFKEMDGLCTTGHLARLTNVIQGYTEDKNFCIRISDKEQIRTVVKKYIETELKNCKDENVINGMFDQNNAYIKFIRLKVSDKLLCWLKEYGSNESKNDLLKMIVESVNSYAGTEVFN